MSRPGWLGTITAAVAALAVAGPARGADVTREEVENAIKEGVRFLKGHQAPDGSWPDADQRAHTGTTSLVTLALLTAGERPDSPAVARALNFLQQAGANDLNRTYSVALQTMAFAAADPVRFRLAIAGNVAWLERAQIKPDDRFGDTAGSWTYDALKAHEGDNSNSQYALLGLHAASEVGVPVKAQAWTLARRYWERAQRKNGSWSYMLYSGDPGTGSMTCAGISSLIICGLRRFEGQEVLLPDGTIKNCGRGGVNDQLQRSIDWVAGNFRVSENPGRGQLWKYYYLYGLERAGRLGGLRFFGDRDWYREGAEYLVKQQDRLTGFWSGRDATEKDPIVATSFALLFLAKGRAPVVVNKLKHGPGNDWNNDHDDVRNLVGVVSRDWKHLLTWQTVDPESAAVEDLHQAPIAYLNGHEAPELSPQAKRTLKEYLETGGFLFAEACCGSRAFDSGFRALMKELFPDREYELHPLAEDHALWRSKYVLTPDVHPLWGVEHGCRTVVVYSPGDLSCYWNQAEVQPEHAMVIKALHVGQNVVDYATGRELPADKLSTPKGTKVRTDSPRRGALHIGKLQHAGEWNIAPMAVPNLTTLLKEKLKFDVVINHRALFARDPNLIYYPLLYVHGRAGMSFEAEDLAALRKHLEPGGGTIFADAACGSPAFDAAFRRFVAELMPDHPLEPIPPDDELYRMPSGFDLADCQYSRAAGGGKGPPQLEGVKLNGHWAVIYSKYDIGCALERAQGGIDCKGYTHESALRIAANIVLYATLP